MSINVENGYIVTLNFSSHHLHTVDEQQYQQRQATLYAHCTDIHIERERERVREYDTNNVFSVCSHSL